jgi:hypothetical protein
MSLAPRGDNFIKGFLRVILQMKTLEIISKASIYNFEARMSAGPLSRV